MVLTGVNCQTPPASRIAPPSQWLVVTIIGDSKSSCSNFHCNAVASALNPPQAAKYPAAKIPVGIKGRPPAFWVRFIRANKSSTGDALGSIMAAIITHHIVNIRPAYPRDHAAGFISMAATPGIPEPRVMAIAVMPVPAPSRIQIQEGAMTVTRAANTTMRSRRSTALRTVVPVAVFGHLRQGQGPTQSNGMCFAEFSVYSNLKPCASTDRIVDFPHVTTCGPGPVSLPGAFIS